MRQEIRLLSEKFKVINIIILLFFPSSFFFSFFFNAKVIPLTSYPTDYVLVCL
jgi:hypothetical protein